MTRMIYILLTIFILKLVDSLAILSSEARRNARKSGTAHQYALRNILRSLYRQQTSTLINHAIPVDPYKLEQARTAIHLLAQKSQNQREEALAKKSGQDIVNRSENSREHTLVKSSENRKEDKIIERSGPNSQGEISREYTLVKSSENRKDDKIQERLGPNSQVENSREYTLVKSSENQKNDKIIKRSRPLIKNHSEVKRGSVNKSKLDRITGVLGKGYLEEAGHIDLLVFNAVTEDDFLTVVPNHMYYDTAKKCANWLDDCSVQGIRAKLLQAYRGPY